MVTGPTCPAPKVANDAGDLRCRHLRARQVCHADRGSERSWKGLGLYCPALRNVNASIAKDGTRFVIHDATVWTVDGYPERPGKAVVFDR